MSRIEVKLSSKAIESILSSAPVQADLEARANRIKAAADSMGSGKYEVSQRKGREGGRPYWVVHVPKDDWTTYYSNKKHKTLQKALSAGK